MQNEKMKYNICNNVLNFHFKTKYVNLNRQYIINKIRQLNQEKIKKKLDIS